MALLILRCSGRERTGWFCACLVTLVVAASLAPPARAQERLNEYEVKAAFLYNFMKFIEWPPPDDCSKDATTLRRFRPPALPRRQRSG